MARFGSFPRALGLWLLLALSTGVRAVAPSPLPALGADLSQTSMSGLSSGAFMTAQFHVVHSDRLVGVGIVAGGPWYCVGSRELFTTDVMDALFSCMQPLVPMAGPNAAKLYQMARRAAEKGRIADLAHLTDDRVYIFAGAADRTVYPSVVAETYRFYRLAGVPEANLVFDTGVAAGHAILTDNDADGACAVTAPPFINDCDFFQSHRILTHIYRDLARPDGTSTGRLLAFDQTEFVDSPYASMSETGYVYIPAPCETDGAACRVHVALHGCRQGAAVIGERYVRTTGYNELADDNRIIVLYPQVEPRSPVPQNPNGCWDWWGYSDPDPRAPTFHTREGIQVRAILAMIERLGAARAQQD